MVGCTPFKRGRWTPDEDELLLAFVKEHGAFSWNTAHLLFPDLHRSGKSCRLRYINQLHPGINRASFTPSEEQTIFHGHFVYGNQWSRIAGMLRGRTDNHVKNVVNMRLKKARRHAARVNFAKRVSSEQRVCTPGLGGSPEKYNYISLPTSACGVSMLPTPQVAMAGMHGTWRCSASSSGRYTSLVTGGGAPMMNDLAAGMGAVCMNEDGPGGAGMMCGNMESSTFSNILASTDCKRVAPSEIMNFNAPPTRSYNECAAHEVLLAQELSEAGRLPSVQRPFESLQLPSVQNSFESFQLQKPLQSLEGSELPSVQISFQSLSLGSDAQQEQVHIARRPNNLGRGDNDLLEAIKFTGYCSSSSNSSGSSAPSPASSPYFDDFCIDSLLKGIEAGIQTSTMSSMSISPASSSASPALNYDLPYPTSSRLNVSGSKQPPEAEAADCMFHDVSSALQQLLVKEENLGAAAGCLMMDGMERELVNMVLGSSNSMWSSMPAAACYVDESASNDLIPDFN